MDGEKIREQLLLRRAVADGVDIHDDEAFGAWAMRHPELWPKGAHIEARAKLQECFGCHLVDFARRPIPDVTNHAVQATDYIRCAFDEDGMLVIDMDDLARVCGVDLDAETLAELAPHLSTGTAQGSHMTKGKPN